MTREKIKNLIQKSIKELQMAKRLPKFDIPDILVERPEEKTHGDYSTNIAMKMARFVGKTPMEIANSLSSELRTESTEFLEKVEAVKPGFINFFLSKEYLQKKIRDILKKQEKFGQLKLSQNQKVNVEFISANPTGPLHVGNGRGGFCGDVLANVLNKAGYKAKKEYYVNDIGKQINILGDSIISPEYDGYKGEYINELRGKIEGNDADKVGKKAAKIILNDDIKGGGIKKTIKKMRIQFDVWFFESSLYPEKTDKVLDVLKKKGLTREENGAIWFKSADFNDDKDRVLVKSKKENNEKTYFLSDIAYLRNKLTERGFDEIIFFWGAEHHGYVNRLKAAAKALGYNPDKVKIIITQLVKLIEKGKQVRMSKRTGVYITLADLIDEISPDEEKSVDVIRFFFLNRKADSHLNFDLELAKDQSEKNPVYYIQYAHARICSIIKKLKIEKEKATVKDLKLLNHSSELGLIKQLIRFPEIIEDTAKDYQVQRIPQYSIDLAVAFHKFYRDCRVISNNKELTKARLSLLLSTKIVLANTLGLMGISAPEKM